jgi:hypothetical protein
MAQVKLRGAAFGLIQDDSYQAVLHVATFMSKALINLTALCDEFG